MHGAGSQELCSVARFCRNGGDCHGQRLISGSVRCVGPLDHRWAERFEGLSLTHARDGTTVLSGPVVDQAALYGLLRQVRDLALPLLSVIQVEPKPADLLDVQP